ncbi:MAG TPA: hypothetical protein VGX76_00915 [Pirellulales bacterium]|nr:hypothetical protein [Pirellulales bacterium]
MWFVDAAALRVRLNTQYRVKRTARATGDVKIATIVKPAPGALQTMSSVAVLTEIQAKTPKTDVMK